LEVKSVPEIWEDDENFAICSPEAHFDDCIEGVCMFCKIAVFFRPETAVLSKKLCFRCFKKRVDSGEISEEDLSAVFTEKTRKELEKRFGCKISVGDMVDMLGRMMEVDV